MLNRLLLPVVSALVALTAPAFEEVTGPAAPAITAYLGSTKSKCWRDNVDKQCRISDLAESVAVHYARSFWPSMTDAISR